MNPLELSPAERRKLFTEALAAADPLAGKLFALADGEAEEPRQRLLESLAIIIAGGAFEVFTEHAAPALVVALLVAKKPPSLCDCPACRAGSETEDHFGA